MAEQQDIDRGRPSEALERDVARRTAELHLLYEVVSYINSAPSFPQALRFVLRRVAEHNGWCFGHAYLVFEKDRDVLQPPTVWYEQPAGRFSAFRRATRHFQPRRGEGLPGRVLDTGQAHWLNDLAEELTARRADLAEDLGIRTALAFPVINEDQVVAVLEFFSDEAFEPDEVTIETMSSIGAQLGWLIQRKQLKQRLVERTVEERQLLGQQLHDGLGQQIASVAILTQRMAHRLEQGKDVRPQDMKRLVSQIDDAMREVRTLAHGLMPVQVQAGQLRAAFEELSSQTAIIVPCNLICNSPVEIDDHEVATNIYMIAREAVHNAVKHAQCRRIVIRLDEVESNFRVSIEDDGRGMEAGRRAAERQARSAGVEGGLGMRIMRFRADLIGAALTFKPRDGGGTVVQCEWPINPDHA